MGSSTSGPPVSPPPQAGKKTNKNKTSAKIVFDNFTLFTLSFVSINTTKYWLDYFNINFDCCPIQWDRGWMVDATIKMQPHSPRVGERVWVVGDVGVRGDSGF